jgi:hypothetical protein
MSWLSSRLSPDEHSSPFFQQLDKDGAIPLTNSLNLADKFRIEFKTKQSKGKPYADNTPYRLGQLIISKVYIGRSQPSLDFRQ